MTFYWEKLPQKNRVLPGFISLSNQGNLSVLGEEPARQRIFHQIDPAVQV
jgi:hypothetical protein